MNIYVCGDVHYPMDAEKLLKLNEIATEDDILIQLGDMGVVWWSEEHTNKNIKELSQLKYKIFFIDGNHEHFPMLNRFKTEKMYGGTVHKIGNSGNLYHLMRGETYVINGYKFLCMGGAASTDRGWRLEGLDWFPDEEANSVEINRLMDNIEKNTDYDFILTHDAPYQIVKEIVGSKIIRSSTTQKILNEIAKRCRWYKWYFGHHHIDRDFDNNFTCLYDTVRNCITDEVVLVNLIKD